MRPGVVVFPASNCERDIITVLKEVYELEALPIWHSDEFIGDDITHLFLPGGFSFGDYLRAGALAAHSPIMRAVKTFAQNGKKILGICNGFQVLCEAGLLPGTLLKNSHGRFVCKITKADYSGMNCSLAPIAIDVAVAHGEGRYFADEETLEQLERNQQIILRYQELDEDNAASINGSAHGIAGIVAGIKRNIIGMMPHPERLAREAMHGRDGCVILQEFLFG
ncbi:MAG: phosphoribosylformylglycinamidine synthase subunit PurQ [Myxococcales bacterium]|nr:MAG: phosphoribosylformylglycinamidine synthase subunit PurQ [Myxococcales bacterium]